MKAKNIWSSTQSLLVVFNYKDDDHLRDFRKSLDLMLNNSQVGRLVIVVNIPKEIDKATLPPHFLIYYNSPNDYTFFGKMKDVLLQTELHKNYDLLIMILLRYIFLLIILCLFENSDYFCIRFSNKVHTILNPDVSGVCFGR